MLESVLGTEILIEKVLGMVKSVEEEIEDWPRDTHPNDDIINGLSYTKMVNEVNHREPRGLTESGVIEKYSLCGSSTGWHSTSKSWRGTDMENLGVGVILYFKMLKYFSLCFLLFSILSVPSMMIYMSGHEYSSHNVLI